MAQDTNFNDWDVPMSPVVGNIGSTGASVAVTKGYSVANSAYVSDPQSLSLDYCVAKRTKPI